MGNKKRDWETPPLKARAIEPLVKRSKNFREVSPSGGPDFGDIIRGNQIGTLDVD